MTTLSLVEQYNYEKLAFESDAVYVIPFLSEKTNVWFWGTPAKTYLFAIGKGAELNNADKNWKLIQIRKDIETYRKSVALYGGPLIFNPNAQ